MILPVILPVQFCDEKCRLSPQERSSKRETADTALCDVLVGRCNPGNFGGPTGTDAIRSIRADRFPLVVACLNNRRRNTCNGSMGTRHLPGGWAGVLSGIHSLAGVGLSKLDTLGIRESIRLVHTGVLSTVSQGPTHDECLRGRRNACRSSVIHCRNCEFVSGSIRVSCWDCCNDRIVLGRSLSDSTSLLCWSEYVQVEERQP